MAGEPRKLVFIHVLKAGGTSLANMLWNSEPSESARYPGPGDFTTSSRDEQVVEMHQLYLMNPLTNPRLTPERRAQIRVACGHIGYTMARAFGDDFVRVTMLREPVDRVISHLRGLQAEGGHSRTLAEIYHEQDTKEFRYLDNLQTRVFASIATDVPTILHDFLQVTDVTARRAAENLRTLDVVGLTGRFAESVQRIEERTGRSLGAVMHENRKKADDPVPGELRQEIAERNRYDAGLYEAALALFEERR